MSDPGELTPVEPVPFDPTDTPAARVAAGVRGLRNKVRVALVANAAFLALDPPTPAQIAAQVGALTRQVNALVRLLAGDDLLDEDTDTDT